MISTPAAAASSPATAVGDSSSLMHISDTGEVKEVCTDPLADTFTLRVEKERRDCCFF
jgi:hypothetical protein